MALKWKRNMNKQRKYGRRGYEVLVDQSKAWLVKKCFKYVKAVEKL